MEQLKTLKIHHLRPIVGTKAVGATSKWLLNVIMENVGVGDNVTVIVHSI